MSAPEILGNAPLGSALTTYPTHVDVEPPSSPDPVVVTETGPRKAKVTWSVSTDNVAMARYDLLRDGEQIAIFREPVGTLEYVDEFLVPGQTYEYQVAAIDTSANRKLSTPTNYLVPADAFVPSAPFNVRPVERSDRRVRVTWGHYDADLPATSFEILRDSVVIATVSASNPWSYDDPIILAYAQTYTYEVRAIDNSGGQSPLSPAATVRISQPRLADPPTASGGTGYSATLPQTARTGIVTFLEIHTQNAVGTIRVSWDPSTDDVAVANYKIYRDSVHVGTLPHPTTFFDDLMADASVTYLYQVEAIDTSGNSSGLSSSVQITTSSNSEILRYASVSDRSQWSAHRTITFDGKTWTFAKIRRPSIREDTSGRSATIAIELFDSSRKIRREFGSKPMAGVKVYAWFVPWSALGNPTSAKRRTWAIRSWAAQEGPARVSLEIGPPPISEVTLASRIYNSERCENDWTNRYKIGNLCGWGTDEFTIQTAQPFIAPSAAELELDYGWFIVNGSEPGYLSGINSGTGALRLIIERKETVSSLFWDDSSKTAPFIFRKVGATAEDEDENVDFSTSVDLDSGSNEIKVVLLIQEETDPSKYVYVEHNFFTSQVSLVANSGAGESSQTNPAPNKHIRLRRIGDVFTAFSRNSDTNPWVELFSSTVSMTGVIRIGVSAWQSTAYSAPGTDTSVIDINHFRLNAGGFRFCQLTERACAIRKWRHRINLFGGLAS